MHGRFFFIEWNSVEKQTTAMAASVWLVFPSRDSWPAGRCKRPDGPTDQERAPTLSSPVSVVGKHQAGQIHVPQPRSRP